MALTDMVLMPGADYQAICDAVRAKTGGTELLKSGEIPALIEAIQGGEVSEAAQVTISFQLDMTSYSACSVMFKPDDAGTWHFNFASGTSTTKILSHLKVGDVIAIEVAGVTSSAGVATTVTGGTKKGVGYSNNQNGTTVHRRLILVTITDAACKISIK